MHHPGTLAAWLGTVTRGSHVLVPDIGREGGILTLVVAFANLSLPLVVVVLVIALGCAVSSPWRAY